MAQLRDHPPRRRNFILSSHISIPSYSDTEIRRSSLRQRVCSTYRPIEATDENAEEERGHARSEHTMETVQEGVELQQRGSTVNTRAEPCIYSGRIRFLGYKCPLCAAQFMKIDFQTDMETVWEHLKGRDVWNLPDPGLVMAVIGDVQHHPLSPHLKTVLTENIVSVATKTGAWVITDGFTGGVAQMVGEALKGEVHYADMDGRNMYNPVRLLAVGSWGEVANKEALQKGRKAEYRRNAIQAGKGRLLDHHQSHFLLVDDGMDGKHGADGGFREKLLTFISKRPLAEPLNEGDTDFAEESDGIQMKIPSLLIVVGGDLDILREVYGALTNDRLVLVLCGSGGAADLIIEACRFELPGASPVDVNSKEFQSAFEREITTKVPELLKTAITSKVFTCLRQCWIKKDLIIKFKGSAEEHADTFSSLLESHILEKNCNPCPRLQLALAWDSCVMARKHITKDYKLLSPQEKECMKQCMKTALFNNQGNFVDFFLSYDVELEGLLTVGNLRDLYNPEKIMVDEESRSLIGYLFSEAQGKETDEKFLGSIDDVIVRLLRDDRFRFYSEHFKKDGEEAKARTMRGLFLWAVLFDQSKLAQVFWLEGQDQIGSALVASRLLKCLSKVAKKKHFIHRGNELVSQSQEWEEIANGVIMKCSSLADSSTCMGLLERPLRFWAPPNENPVTLLDITWLFRRRGFAVHSACQTKVRDDWMGVIARDTPDWKVLLCTILPFLFFLIKRKEPGKGCCRGGRAISFCDFLAAPFVKFLCQMIEHNLFMFLLSYYLIVDLARYESVWAIMPSEWMIHVYMVFLFVGEVRDMKYQCRCCRIKHGWKPWFRDNFQRQFDVVMYLAYIVSLILRFCSEKCLEEKYERFAWCFMLVATYLSDFKYLFVLKSLGPKTFAIHMMLFDFLQILAIGFLFVGGFGIAYYAMMFPNSPAGVFTMYRILTVPFYQAFGEIEREQFQGFVSRPHDGCDTEVAADDIDNITERCPEANPFLPLSMIGYFVVMNLMFMSLVIAQFTNTFNKIQEKSYELWLLSRVYVLRIYSNKPIFTCFIAPCCCKRKGVNDKKMTELEKWAAESFILSKKDVCGEAK